MNRPLPWLLAVVGLTACGADGTTNEPAQDATPAVPDAVEGDAGAVVPDADAGAIIPDADAGAGAVSPDAGAVSPDAGEDLPDAGAPPPPALALAAAEVSAAVTPWVEAGWLPAASMALVVGEHTHFLDFGEISAARPEPPTPDALYAIGSVSKTFTGLLLADAVERGEHTLDTPLQALLPEGVTAPTFEGVGIALSHLTTHTSALPRDAVDPDTPEPRWYADFTLDNLWTWLAGVSLDRAPGAELVYSNAGTGLLGQVLAFAAQTDYETLLRDRVTGPLALPDTLAVLDPDHAAAFVPGRVDEVEVEYQHLAALSPAGGFVSSTRAMARYLQFQTGARSGPLDAAITRAQTPLRPVGEGMQIAYNWFVQTSPRYVFHDGSVPGHATNVIFGPENDLGVVFLTASNTYAVYPLTNFALARLAGVEVPAPTPPAEGFVEPARLDDYVGTYTVGPAMRFFVTRSDPHLSFRLSGQEAIRLYPDAEAEDAFHLRVVLARVTFERDAEGAVLRCVLHQNGQRIAGTR